LLALLFLPRWRCGVFFPPVLLVPLEPLLLLLLLSMGLLLLVESGPRSPPVSFERLLGLLLESMSSSTRSRSLLLLLLLVLVLLVAPVVVVVVVVLPVAAATLALAFILGLGVAPLALVLALPAADRWSFSNSFIRTPRRCRCGHARSRTWVGFFFGIVLAFCCALASVWLMVV